MHGHYESLGGRTLPEDVPSDKDEATPPGSSHRGDQKREGSRSVVLDASGGLYKLKKSLMSEVGPFERYFMFNAGLETAKEYVSKIPKGTVPTDPEGAIKAFLAELSGIGLGNTELVDLDASERVATFTSKDSVEAWSFQERQDLQQGPVCSYLAGALTWICRIALDREGAIDSDLLPLETECVGANGRICKFVVGPEDALRKDLAGNRSPMKPGPEYDLRFNEEILEKNLELQGLNLSLERQIRKRTEDLWKSEDNYRATISMNPDPIALFTSDGRVISLNPSGLEMLNIDSLEEITTAKAETVFAGGKAVWDKIVWLLEKEGVVKGFETQIVRRDGGKAIVQITARFASLQQGQCVEAILRDVTEEKAMEEGMREAQSEAEHLNDLMSHDVMNHAFAALHYLEKLRRSSNLSEEEKRELLLVTKEVQGAFELSASVRDLARIRTLEDEGTLVMDLKNLIGEATESAKRMFSDRTVRINFEKPSEAAYVSCNALATNLFTNLLTNAIKFDSHTEVVIDILIDSFAEGGLSYWRTMIIDRGRGIPDSDKEKVFDRFRRVDKSVSGSGLGLYVVRYITNAIGGRIWAENRIEGDHTQGTKMVVLLLKADEKQIARLVRKA